MLDAGRALIGSEKRNWDEGRPEPPPYPPTARGSLQAGMLRRRAPYARSCRRDSFREADDGRERRREGQSFMTGERAEHRDGLSAAVNEPHVPPFPGPPGAVLSGQPPTRLRR
jgi:hypothetical protein